MIEYIVPQNPDDRILGKAADLIKAGELICFPTDTNWIVACDPESKDAVTKLYKLKDAGPQKHFSLLCDSISRASQLAIIDDSAFRTLKRLIPGHYTFIFEATKLMAKTLKASKADKEVGLRFVPIDWVNKLINILDCCLLSTNLEQEQIGEEPPFYSYMIEESLRGSIKMILDPGEFEFVGPSTIISFTDGSAELVREGSGQWP